MTNVEKRIIELILAEAGLESILAGVDDRITKTASEGEADTSRRGEYTG